MSLCLAFPLEASAWDSQAHNPTHSTHSHITEWAMDRAAKGCAEIGPHRAAVLDGANRELHELRVKGSAHGVDLEAARSRHRGTNAGCDDIEGWWDECLAAYRAGARDKAFFLLGVMLHMIEDMGVPAHANGVYHQGNPVEFDNFEVMALWNWKPSFESIDRKDPAYSDPWRYYAFSQEWAHADAPDYHDRSTFSKTWLFASREERRLLRNRQGRTCYVTLWALESACRAFEAKPGSRVPAPPGHEELNRARGQLGTRAAQSGVAPQSRSATAALSRRFPRIAARTPGLRSNHVGPLPWH